MQGNQMLRGVSGGQKKRVSTGEVGLLDPRTAARRMDMYLFAGTFRPQYIWQGARGGANGMTQCMHSIG